MRLADPVRHGLIHAEGAPGTAQGRVEVAALLVHPAEVELGSRLARGLAELAPQREGPGEMVQCAIGFPELEAGPADVQVRVGLRADITEPGRRGQRDLLAGGAWQQALDIFTDLQHPDTARVRAKLAELRPPGPGRPGAFP